MTSYQRRVLAQTERWVEGDIRHNVVDDECCPDFSCCVPEMFTVDPADRLAVLLAFRQRVGLPPLAPVPTPGVCSVKPVAQRSSAPERQSAGSPSAPLLGFRDG